MILSPHEGKTGPHFNKKLLYVHDQADFHITLIVLPGKRQHIEYVRVFEHQLHIIGLRRRQDVCEIVCQRPMLAVIVKSYGFLEVTF